MPGGQFADFRGGNKAELLANYLLEHLAFVVRVPREEDVGADFMCSLIEPRGKILGAGAFFTVQVKSNSEPIRYAKKHSVKWIVRQENPLFIALVDITKGKMDLFSTWRKLNAFLRKLAPTVRLIPGHQKKGDYIYYTKSGKRLDVYLGDPAITLSLDDLSVDERVSERRSLLEEWVHIDRRNIVHRDAKLFWVEGPLNHKTNLPPFPSEDSVWEQRFFTNPKNIKSTLENYINASAALLRESEDLNHPEAKKFRDDLTRHLVSQKDTLDEQHLQVLRNVGKLDV